MSFNIRHAAAEDGENSWPHRRDLVAHVIRNHSPDLIGLQEVLPVQAEYLAEQLPEYVWVTSGRQQRRGETPAVLVRQESLRLVGTGCFWLSETPQIAESTSWDTAHPRLVVWAHVRTRDDGQSMWLYNAHFDHQGEVARLESARLLRDQLPDDRSPILVTGDFNSTEDDPPYRNLLSVDPASTALLVDAYRAAHPRRDPDELTRHDFTGRHDGSRIDWILHSDHFETVAARIDRFCHEGRHPSDHFPVVAQLQRQASSSEGRQPA